MESTTIRSLLTKTACFAAAVTLASSLAYANGSGGGGGTFGGAGDSAQIQISGSIPGTCQFTTLPNVSSLGALVSGGPPVDLGALGFTCNLATIANVTLKVQSANGALKRDGGPETVAYSVAWNIQGASNVFYPTAPWISLSDYPTTISSGPSGVQQSGAYRVTVTGATVGLPAGTYRDTITYTISP